MALKFHSLRLPTCRNYHLHSAHIPKRSQFFSRTMHTAQVQNWAEGPRYTTAPDPPAPSPSQLRLRVLAAGLHQVVRSRASGQHYSAKQLPHVPGIDCVGKDEDTGALYYVMSMSDGAGTFVEHVIVDRAAAISLPSDGSVDVARFAASVNPAVSSWMAITQRTSDLPAGFTVLIIGATSASGRLAVHAAKALGAGKVVGAGRGEDALKGVEGLDEYVVLRDAVSETDFSSVEPDVVLDYVYGDVAVHFFTSLRTKKPVQYVHIGSLSKQMEISLPGALLRSTNLTIRGAGPGSWRLSALEVELKTLIPALCKWPLPGAYEAPLKDIEEVWNDKSITGRIVFIP